jgi:methionine salvage enolase-phosphatase E1
VVPQLQQWKKRGYTLAIYSSGAIAAQKGNEKKKTVFFLNFFSF